MISQTTVGMEIGRAREAHGEYNQQSFAAHLGITPAMLSYIESGKKRATFECITRAAELLKRDPGPWIHAALHEGGTMLVDFQKLPGHVRRILGGFLASQEDGGPNDDYRKAA